jgi:hypothetical protein
MRLDKFGEIFDIATDSCTWDVADWLRLFDKFDDPGIGAGRRGNVCELYICQHKRLRRRRRLTNSDRECKLA